MQRSRTAAALAVLAVLTSMALPASPAVPAAAPAASPLTLEQIMAHPDWLGTPPENAYWADDGSAVYYQRKRTGAEERDLYKVALSGGGAGEPKLVPLAERGIVDAGHGEISHDRQW